MGQPDWPSCSRCCWSILAWSSPIETLVRIHRAGEGAPYTGLKPAGRDLGPAIPAADRALESGGVEPLLQLLNDTVRKGIHETFTSATAGKNVSHDDVEAGRAHVKAYVEFIHYVERLYESAKQPAEGHFHEADQANMNEAAH